MIVIPAVDLKGGRCVRLRTGDFAQETVFSDDPVEVARRWEAAGARWLHVVDLDGARLGRIEHGEVIRSIARALSIPIQLGGGLRDAHAVETALGLGVDRVIIGTLAALDKKAAAEIFASFGERVAAAVDAREGRVAVRGWQEQTDMLAVDFARQLHEIGARRLVYTDIGRDGTEAGPDMEGVRAFVSSVPLPVIVAGGVSTPEHIAAIVATGAEGCIVGRAFYTGLMPTDVLRRTW